MIKFFQKIRRKLLTGNQLSKYFLYAFGEILLLVLGILIALQINIANEAKKVQVKETTLLVELKSNLEKNIRNLQEDIVEQTRGAQSITYLINHFENKLPYHDSISYYLQKGDFVPVTILTASAFETLKSSGLDLIKSQTLRSAIIDLFEVTYPHLIVETTNIEDQLWSSVVVPRLIKYTKHDGGRYIPSNYEAMINDQEFINMWYQRRTFRKYSSSQKETAVIKTQELITLIGHELDKRGQGEH